VLLQNHNHCSYGEAPDVHRGTAGCGYERRRLASATHVRFRCCGGLRQRHVSTIEPAAAEMAAIWRESGMQGVTTIGLDIAKSVFQIHGVDAARGCLGWDITNVH
jgi:hypothetical protein